MSSSSSPFFIATLLCVITAAGCQTPRQKEIESVQVGMNKNAVLAAAGNPNVTRRWKGLDRWIYIFENAPSREVHFLEGRAVYVGPEPQPQPTADKQDLDNAASNTAEAARLEEETRTARASNEKLGNSSSSETDERRKIAPTFIPVQ